MARRTTSTKIAGDGQPLRRWDDAIADLFIDTLIGTRNVTAAAAAIGFSRERCYNIRNTDSVFAARWAKVMDTAREHAREQSVLGAEAALAKAAADNTMTVREALAVLAMKGPDGRSPAIVPLDPEAARAELIEMVLTIKRAREDA